MTKESEETVRARARAKAEKLTLAYRTDKTEHGHGKYDHYSDFTTVDGTQIEVDLGPEGEPQAATA